MSACSFRIFCRPFFGFKRNCLIRYISEKVVRALAVGAVPVMWSRVEGWESIVPGPHAAVFVEDFGFDALQLVQALESEAQDEQMYSRVRVISSILYIVIQTQRFPPPLPPPPRIFSFWMR